MNRRALIVVVLVGLLVLLVLGCSFSLGGSKAPTDTPIIPTSTSTPALPTATPTELLLTPTVVPSPAPTGAAETGGIERGGGAPSGAQGKEGPSASTGTIKKRSEAASAVDKFTFLSHTGWVDEKGNISIVGEVRNDSDQTVNTMVAVQALLSDSEGNVIQGDFAAYLDRPVITPGQTSSFWVYITAEELGDTDPQSIVDYELKLWDTGRPSPDVELEVVQSEATVEDDGLYISGTVRNQTNQEFAAIAVYSTLYDADGNVINVTLDYRELDVPLSPGEETEFVGWFPERYEDAERYGVIVTGFAEPEAERRSAEDALRSGEGLFEFVSTRSWTEEDGALSIVGEVRNVSGETFDRLIIVEAVLFDENGEVIKGDFSAYLDRPVIRPGEVSSFWIYARPDDFAAGWSAEDVARYELALWVTEEQSPDIELQVLESRATEERDGLHIRGRVRNQTNESMDTLAVYSTLYDADGNVVNVTVDTVQLDRPLKPGQEAEFDGWFPERYEEADHYLVVVTGYPSSR